MKKINSNNVFVKSAAGAVLPIWSVYRFKVILGKDIVYMAKTSADKDMVFFQSLLDSATEVDMNDPDVYSMVEGLNLSSPQVIDDDRFKVLKGE